MHDQMKQYRMHGMTMEHRKRVEDALAVLSRVFERHRCLISSSWGKDSICLVDLACRVVDRPHVLYMPFPHPLPGLDPVIAQFSDRIHYHKTPQTPMNDYISWLHEVGLPHERTRSAQGSAVRGLKKDKASQWAEANGFDAMALGMRADENGNTRGKLFRYKGPVYKKGSITFANPLAFWSARDVWAYIFERKLVYHELYDHETHGQTRESLRNTGWLSTDGAVDRGRLAWLRHHYPQYHERLVAEFPDARGLA